MHKIETGHRYVIFLPAPDGLPDEHMDYVRATLESGGGEVVEVFAVHGLAAVDVIDVTTTKP